MIKLRTWYWICGVLVLARILLGLYPPLTDVVYREGLFVPIRWLLDKTFGILPVPGVFLLLFLLLWPFVRPYMFPKMRMKKRAAFWKRAVKFSLQVVSYFLILWGFNYGASDMNYRGQEDVSLSFDTIESRYLREISACNQYRSRVDHFPEHVDNTTHNSIKRALRGVLASDDWADHGNPNCRLVFANSGILRRIGIQGIYLPFTGEGYVDASLPFIQQTFTYAHEMSHGFGIANEGDCNWMAYRALMESNNAQLRYSGHFIAMRYLHHALLQTDPELNMDAYTAQYSEDVHSDLQKIRDNQRLYPTWMPGLADLSNDAYLKINGSEEGIASYDEMVKWLIQFEK